MAADLITDVVVFLLMLTMVGDYVLILSPKSTMTVWYEGVLLTWNLFTLIKLLLSLVAEFVANVDCASLSVARKMPDLIGDNANLTVPHLED